MSHGVVELSENALVLAIDPGKLTGIALMRKSGDDVSIVWSDELEYHATGDRVNYAIGTYGKELEIACENFFISAQTGKKSQQTWSLRLIGAIEYLCYAHQVDQPTLQPPSRAKEFVPNDALRRIGLWHVGGEGHARDAIRHGVLYLVEKHQWRPSQLLAE